MLYKYIGREKEYKHEWWLRNKKRLSIKAYKYCLKHKEEKKAYDKKYNQRPEVKKKKKKYGKKYYLKHKKKWDKYYKKYHKKPKAKETKNKYRKKRRKLDKQYALKDRLRCSLRRAFRQYSQTGKIKTSNEYGINYEVIIEHLKPFPKDIKKYDIDHIKPLCLFNFDNPKEVKEAFKPENHRWLLKSINRSNGAKLKYFKK